MTSSNKVTLLQHKNYLRVIKNSIGSRMFQNVYAEVGGTEKDITRNGELSCAFFVSSILQIFNQIDTVHTTVTGTVSDLRASGWTEIEEPRPGAVLVWESKLYASGERHPHIGFYIGDKQAISNSDTALTPVAHHWTFDTHKDGSNKRAVTNIFWNEQLNNNS